MALRDWIGKTNGVATATVATTATVDRQNRGSVAKVATVSVATPPKSSISLLDPNQAHRAERLTYPDGSTKEQFTLPEATHAEILELWPEVTAAEPFDPVKSEDVCHIEATKVSKAPSVPFVAPEWAPSRQISTATIDREAFEERAAIREFDGGFNRKEAERLAHDDLRARVGAKW